jgi:hypothetical protein
MKSSGVAQNHSGEKFLADIAKLDITIYAVIVDKTKLDGKGFAIKNHFINILITWFTKNSIEHFQTRTSC